MAAVGHTGGGRRAPADAGGPGPVAAASKLSVGRGGMGIVGTALIYLLVVTVVAAAFFGVAALVFGRGEELAPLAARRHPHPAARRTAIRGEDIRELRFPQAVRGYRMTEVDWVLDRLAEEIDRLTQRARRARRRRVASRASPERVHVTGGSSSPLPVDVNAPAEVVWHTVTDWPGQGEWMLGTRVEVDGRRRRPPPRRAAAGRHRGRGPSASPTPWRSSSGSRRGGASCATPARSCAATACSRWCRSARIGPGSSGRSCWTCRWARSGRWAGRVVEPVFRLGDRASLRAMARRCERG